MARAKSVTDVTTLQMALVGYQVEKQKIEERIREIRLQIKGRPAVFAVGDGNLTAPAAKRQLSAGARRRIAAAQKKRWAEHRRRKAAEAKKG